MGRHLSHTPAHEAGGCIRGLLDYEEWMCFFFHCPIITDVSLSESQETNCSETFLIDAIVYFEYMRNI